MHAAVSTEPPAPTMRLGHALGLFESLLVGIWSYLGGTFLISSQFSSIFSDPYCDTVGVVAGCRYMARSVGENVIDRERGPRVVDSETSPDRLSTLSLSAAHRALDAVAFIAQPGQSADIAGFVTANPQIPKPGDAPRYLLFGPAAVYALCSTSSHSARPDPHLRLIHTGDSNELGTVALTCSGSHDARPVVSTVQLREPTAKFNAHARLAVVKAGDETTMVLVPHPAVLLVLSASELFGTADHADHSCRALLQHLIDRPTTESPREWRKLISDTVDSFSTPLLRDTALARISTAIDRICREMSPGHATDRLRDLLS